VRQWRGGSATGQNQTPRKGGGFDGYLYHITGEGSKKKNQVARRKGGTSEGAKIWETGIRKSELG